MSRLRIFLANVGLKNPHPLVTPPMGIMCLAAFVRTRFETDLMLVNQRLDNCSNENLARRAIDFKADIVGLGALTPNAHHIPHITRLIRKEMPKSLIVLGGPHASAIGAKALQDTEADAAVCGEGELSFEAVIQAYSAGRNFADIPGLCWKDGDRITANPGMTPFVKDLDSLPFPAYDLIDLPAYWKQQSMPPIPRHRYISLFSSRGCPYRCIYCHRIFGDGYRYNSAERIVDEIEYYRKLYGIEEIEFLDDIFNLKRDRLLEFCELLQKRNLRVKIAFPNGVRSDVLKEDEIEALVDAGLHYCSFALESGSPRIQKLIGKNLNIDKYLKSVESASSRGVFCNGFAMLGFPTETENEIRQTIDVACRSRLHTASFFTVTPFPKTDLYDMILKTHPEKLARLRYDDMEYCHAPINFSDVPDERLFGCQRQANRRFFLNGRRLIRILRHFPEPYKLPLYLPEFLKRVSKGLLRQSDR